MTPAGDGAIVGSLPDSLPMSFPDSLPTPLPNPLPVSRVHIVDIAASLSAWTSIEASKLTKSLITYKS